MNCSIKSRSFIVSLWKANVDAARWQAAMRTVYCKRFSGVMLG